MSIMIRDEETKTYRLICKGADSIIEKRLLAGGDRGSGS